MQKRYLQAMGIQTWRLRQPLPGAKSSIYYPYYQLLQHQQPVANLILAQPVTSTHEQELLTAMLKAIQLELSDSMLISHDNIQALNIQLPLLVMGKQLEQYIEKTNQVMMTYHPRQILTEKSLKRPTWEALKQFKTIL